MALPVMMGYGVQKLMYALVVCVIGQPVTVQGQEISVMLEYVMMV
jgi:hypothetical protein